MGVRQRLAIATGLGVAAGALTVSGLLPALGAGDALPDVVFLARSDLAADALSAGPVAGQLGAPLLTTPPTFLADPTAAALADLDPELVIVTGGTAAISDAVVADAAAACGCAVERVSGAGREATAVAVTGLLARYGIEGPLVAGATRAGDATLTGRLSAGEIAVDGVVRLGSAELHVPLAGTPATNGQALRAAVATLAGTRPAVVSLGPGTAHLGDTALILPDGLRLRGAGRDVTTITGTPAATAGDAGLLRVAVSDGSNRPTVAVQDLTVTLPGQEPGYATALRVPARAALELDRVDVRVGSVDTGTATVTAGIQGTSAGGDSSHLLLLDTSVIVLFGGGNDGAVTDGDASLRGSDLDISKAGDVVTLDAVTVRLEASSVRGLATTVPVVRAAGRVLLDRSLVDGGATSTTDDVFADFSRIAGDVTAADQVALTMSVVRGMITRGSGSNPCPGSVDGDGTPLPNVCR